MALLHALTADPRSRGGIVAACVVAGVSEAVALRTEQARGLAADIEGLAMYVGTAERESGWKP
jgi:hypothetical protein